jgi:putative transposase
MCYIELNSIRAAMVAYPAHYRWTSYRANALGQTSPLVVPHTIISALMIVRGKRPTVICSNTISMTRQSPNRASR